jgi:hypothetical protein
MHFVLNDVLTNGGTGTKKDGGFMAVRFYRIAKRLYSALVLMGLVALAIMMQVRLSWSSRGLVDIFALLSLGKLELFMNVYCLT